MTNQVNNLPALPAATLRLHGGGLFLTEEQYKCFTHMPAWQRKEMLGKYQPTNDQEGLRWELDWYMNW